MDPNTNLQCVIIKDGEQNIHQYHFCGNTEFSLASYLQNNPQITIKMEYLGKGKIHSIEGVLQASPKQEVYHFWRMKDLPVNPINN